MLKRDAISYGSGVSCSRLIEEQKLLLQLETQGSGQRSSLGLCRDPMAILRGVRHRLRQG